VTRFYGHRAVLKNVSFRWPEGQTHVLLGQSGSGKTTVLRTLMGLLTPTEGEVRIGKRLLGEVSREEWLRSIGYIPQQGGLFPHLTARNNVLLVAEARGWNRQQIEQRWEELFPVIQLSRDLMNRYPKELSGGEIQRVAIFRALFLNPQLLVLDEPLSALDPIVRSNLQTELKNLFNGLKKTVVIVTHDLAEAAYFGHSINILRGGELLQSGSFEELSTHPAHPYVEEFVRSQRSIEIEGLHG
jgi:osmoprotectant transport system ATP-binding protein